MAQVNPNDVATAAIQVLQAAIDRLSALKLKHGADIAGIDAQIGKLQDKQDDFRVQALRTIEDSDANKQAIAAMNDAAANLKTEAATIKDAATLLTGVAQVLSAAAALLAALAPFL
ncbi:MAG TPA: hypothetical protein VND19_23405 [Acetobacteraceae bacterium]|nr:hypothetical protein [Acetobacteraceae bacterium]